MTTTTNASTGTATAEAAGQPDKPFGMARVREAETYHNASVLDDAVSEAYRLVTALQHAISDAHFGDIGKAREKGTGLTATQTAESPPMQARVQEALNCLQAAQDYARRLLVSTYEPPF
jgi:hypothetical protein